jgi:mRNA-degrading endonuclease toxin of MazEF toxin-antitoxin module
MRIDPDENNGLASPSVLLVFQLRAIDKCRLQSLAGRISSAELDQVMQMIDRLLGRRT